MLAEINSSIIYNSFYQHLVICKVRVWTTLYKETQCFGSGRYEDIFVYDSNLTFISPIWPSLCFIDAKMFAEINSSIIYYWDEFHTPLFSNLIMQVWEKWCVCHKLANVSLCCLVSLEAATMYTFPYNVAHIFLQCKMSKFFMLFLVKNAIFYA